MNKADQPYEITKRHKPSEKPKSFSWTCKICRKVSLPWDYLYNMRSEIRKHMLAHGLRDTELRYMRMPRVEFFSEGGGVVMGTQDVEAAMLLIQRAAVENGMDPEEAEEYFDAQDGIQTYAHKNYRTGQGCEGHWTLATDDEPIYGYVASVVWWE